MNTRPAGAQSSIFPSVCPHDCPSVCSLQLEIAADGRLGKVRGGDQPYTDGVICAKVARYAERANHPERLMRPLRRVGPKGSGQFEAIGWDQALDLVAENLSQAMEKHGPETVWPYHYAGTMGLVQRAALRRLGHLAGWSRQQETFCVALADAGWQAGVGAKHGVDAREVVDSELIVVWGGNPVHTQINFMHWVQKARRQTGAKLVVVDPYRTATAEKADVHLMLRPGTDGALACAVMHVLLREGLADRDYLARCTDFSLAVERHLESKTPEWAASVTGLDSAEIIAFARQYGATRRSFLRIGYGFTRQRNGAAAMHAVSCLPAVTGAWQEKGGGALYGHSAIYGLERSFLNGLDRPVPATRQMDMSALGAVLAGDPGALRGGPPVTAMLVQNTNPAVVAPESLAVRQGLLRDDLFLCVHEQFMTDTARLADRSYLARLTDFSPAVERHLASKTPEWAASVTGLDSAEIISFAQLYGATRRSFMRIGYGFTRQRNGAAAMHAVSCLPAVTGAWQEKGGGALYGHSAIYGLERSFLNGLDRPVPAARQMDMSALGAVLAGDPGALRGGPPVTAMLIQNTNPAVVAPESLAVREGLLRNDLFLCVHEQFMTDTARLADVVLPATMFTEHDDLYQASGHTFLQVAKAVLEPPGECRSNHDFIGQLAGLMGVEHPAFTMDAGALVDQVLTASGKPGSDEVLRQGWLDCALPFAKAHFLDGFGHPGGRFRFAPDWPAIGPNHDVMPAMPDQLDVIENVSAETPFRLVPAPARHFLNSTFTETEKSKTGEGRPTVLVHPDTAGNLGIADGSLVCLGNRRGMVRLHARLFDGVQPTTLVVESQWPNASFVDGIGINTLVGAAPGFPNGGAAYHDTAVWLAQDR